MARNRNKKKSPKVRNHHAVAAALRSGSGKHQDRRTRRCRTRGQQDQAAIKEFS